MSETIAFIDGQVFNPKTKSFEQQNIVLSNGQWVGAGYVPDEDPSTVVYSIKNYHLVPNVTDSWAIVDSRDTAQKMSEAGVTAAAALPSSKIACDTPESFFMTALSGNEYPLSLFWFSSLTQGKKGSHLAELTLLTEKGAIGFSDGGNSPDFSPLMKHAFHYSKLLERPLVISPADPQLSEGGMMNEGYYSSILGVKGIPAVAETIRLARDLQLLEAYGGHLHVFPITTACSVELIRAAKQKGLSVTCGTAPHYLMFTEADMDFYPTSKKVFPPLRTQNDVTALIAGLADKTIDVLASHHTPCSRDEKHTDFLQASFGASTASDWISAALTVCHHTHNIPLADIFAALSVTPKKIFNLTLPSWGLRSKPSFSIFDHNADFVSTDPLSPFFNRPLKGKCLATVVNGQMMFKSDTLIQQNVAS